MRRCPDPNARIQKFIHYMATTPQWVVLQNSMRIEFTHSLLICILPVCDRVFYQKWARTDEWPARWKRYLQYNTINIILAGTDYWFRARCNERPRGVNGMTEWWRRWRHAKTVIEMNRRAARNSVASRTLAGTKLPSEIGVWIVNERAGVTGEDGGTAVVG